MRLTVERDALDSALARVCSVVEKRNSIPIVGHVLLRADGGGLRLTATDLDIEVSEAVDARVEARGELTCSASILADFVRGLPSGADVALSFDDGDPRLKVRGGRSRATLPVLPAGDFPAVGDRALDWGGPIDKAVLLRLLGQVAHAVSTEETRHYLQGVYLCTPTVDGRPLLRMVATDGQRMGCADADLPEGFVAIPGDQDGVIVPGKTVKTLLRLLDGAKDCSLTCSAARVRLEAGAAVMGSKIIDGAYPGYERVIPKVGGDVEQQEVGFDPALFLGAVKRVGAFSDGKVRSVQLLVEGGQAQLTARGQESGAEGGETFEADQAEGGARIETAFSARNLADLLGLITPTARFLFQGARGHGGPVLITDAALPGVRHVLMPLLG
jgi:DNA polymerase-3 subunit beta